MVYDIRLMDINRGDMVYQGGILFWLRGSLRDVQDILPVCKVFIF
jgi:hypothetical protein